MQRHLEMWKRTFLPPGILIKDQDAEYEQKPGTCTNRKQQMLHTGMKCFFSPLKTFFKAQLIILTSPRGAQTANISGLPMKQSQGREVIWRVRENFKDQIETEFQTP